MAEMNMREQRIKEVESAPKAQGKMEYLRWLKGEQISRKEAMDANCYVCMGYFVDGRGECSVRLCPMRDYMMYNPERIKRHMSEEQKKASALHLEKVRFSRGARQPAAKRKKK